MIPLRFVAFFAAANVTKCFTMPPRAATGLVRISPRMMATHEDERRLLRGVLKEALEKQSNIRCGLREQLEKSSVPSRTLVPSDEKAAHAHAKALRRAERVPVRLAEIAAAEQHLFELQDRLADSKPDLSALRLDMEAMGLGGRLKNFDVDAEKCGQWGRPDDFEGLVTESPRGVPILISKQSHSDATLRRISRGTDLWFQSRDGRGARVLLRTSMVRGLAKSPRECVETAADFAGHFSGGHRKRRPSSHDASHDGEGTGGGEEEVEVMYTDSRHVAKRGGRVGQLKDAKKMGMVYAKPWRVAEQARELQEQQGWL
mmetsp:Transcript_63394/g.124508  ORF Transcript_63394/g.124508 Transcript_63394/m.124508 type:complete len:316 (-) Transcript_63394:199-1146(-)